MRNMHVTEELTHELSIDEAAGWLGWFRFMDGEFQGQYTVLGWLSG